MEYKINVAKSDDAISLLCVADSIAKLKTTRDGDTTFHKQTYDNIYKRLCSTLVNEVELNKLKLCDCDGIEVAPEQLISNMHIFEKYVIEPNWNEIKKQHPECEVNGSGVFNFSGVNLNLGESKPDLIFSKLYCYQSTIHQLNQWGNGTHKFVAVETPLNEDTSDYNRWHVGFATNSKEVDKKLTSQKITCKAVQKKVIQKVFNGLHFDYDQWGRALGDVPKWLINCRVSRGSKGKRVSHTWDPVLIGLALMDKGITKKQLNLAFMGLKEWLKEWQEKTDLMD